MTKKYYNIIVVGCGGTGSQLLPSLMQICANVNKTPNKVINRILFIDGDKYEAKNLANQRCTYQDIDVNKAEASCRRYKMIYPSLNIAYYDDYIKSEDDLDKIINTNAYTGYYIQYINIIIGCVDNNATRKIMSNYFNHFNNTYYDVNCMYIDSGNDSGINNTNRNGQIVVGFKTSDTKTKKTTIIHKCVGDIYDDIKNNTDNIENVGTCMRVSNEYPQNIATNLMAANILSLILTNYMMFDKIENNFILFDADKLTIVNRNY